MDIRLLHYFLEIARVGNITRAAENLHMTQPTLSRQMKELEEELGTTLMLRGKRQITLTEKGVLFQQRAQDIIALMEKAEQEMISDDSLEGGVVAIGCVESIASRVVTDWLIEFKKIHPKVRYIIYGADAADLRESLDQGGIDLGILLEPAETSKYEYIRLPVLERWGIAMRSDDRLAEKEYITMEELETLPLIIPGRRLPENWQFFQEERKYNIVAAHNLPTNALLLAERRFGYILCVEGSILIRESKDFCFRPIVPERMTGHVMVWKKNRFFNPATNLFLRFVREKAEQNSI